MLFKKNLILSHMREDGRSMLGMLRVLVIISISSIGDVIGYRRGIAKYQSNELINEARIELVEIIPQALDGWEYLRFSTGNASKTSKRICL